MHVFVQLLSIFAMCCAMYGSKLFVDSRFDIGSMSFVLGNITNMVVGFAVGNLALVTVQVILSCFAVSMYRNTRFNLLVGAYGAILFAILGMNPVQRFHLPLLDAIGAILAVRGAIAMRRHDYRAMAWCWIAADLIFMAVAVKEGLIGLFIQSAVFAYHGYKRLQPAPAAR